MKPALQLACCAAGLLFAERARADFMVAADVDAAVPVAASNLSFGAGLGLRLGYRFRLGPIALTPELAGNTQFIGARVLRISPGLRLGVGRLLIPSVYAHVGYGNTEYTNEGSCDLSGACLNHAVTVHGDGLALDAGIALDVHPIRRLSLGAHAGYNVVYTGPTHVEDAYFPVEKWFSLGLHAALFF